MKAKWIRTASVLLLISTILGILPIFGSQQLAYSTSSNSGERDVICTTLNGTGAEDYYGNDYSYDLLSQLPTDYLYDALEELMTDTHKRITSYSDCRDYATITDCENNDGRIMLIYTSYSANGMSDYTNNRSGGWNREHVWPKSLGGFNQTGAGADLHHIRPSDGTVNSTRGNKLYGNADGGKAVYGTAVTQNALGGHFGTYFEPLDNVKGDVARICLYVYVRWAAQFPQCGNLSNVFQSIDVLLEWCALDPVDTWEMGRNEVVGKIQGNRNVFIDYPEYAWLLFDREIPQDMITPSGNAARGEDDPPSCTHTNTELRNASSATCGQNGYTGDTYCKDCHQKIMAGSVISATNDHSFGAWISAADGSQSRTCTVCQKVEKMDAIECKHPSTELRGAVPASCKTEGYTGDIHCADCGKRIVAGNVIPVTDDHSFGAWSTPEEGQSSRTCSICGKVESKTEPTIPAPVCSHTNTECRDAKDASCTEGYSGDIYCTDCGKLVEKGLVYPPNGAHEYDPNTGRLICINCGYEELTHNSENSNTDTWLVVGCICVPVCLIALAVIAVILIKKRHG